VTKYAIEVKSSDGFRPMTLRQFDTMTEATMYSIAFEAMDPSIETRVVSVGETALLAQEAREVKP